MKDTVSTTIRRIFSEVQKIRADEIDMNANLVEVYGIDSLRAVKLLSTLEVEMDFEFPEDQMKSIKTLSDVERITNDQLNADKQKSLNDP